MRIMLLFQFPRGQPDGHAEQGGHLLGVDGVELFLVIADTRGRG